MLRPHYLSVLYYMHIQTTASKINQAKDPTIAYVLPYGKSQRRRRLFVDNLVELDIAFL